MYVDSSFRAYVKRSLAQLTISTSERFADCWYLVEDGCLHTVGPYLVIT